MYGLSESEGKGTAAGDPSGGDRRAAERTGRRIAALGALLIGYMTLLPEPPDPNAPPIGMFCVVCGDLGAVDLLLNVLLFVPFGFGLRLASVPARRALLIAAALSFTIELLQLTLIPGRDATLLDIVTNTLGGGFGIVLAGAWRLAMFPSPAHARRLRVLWGAKWLGLWAISGWLAGISLPETTWYGQVPPVNVYDEDFAGTVLGATLDGVPLGSGRLQKSGQLREQLLREGVRLEVTAVTSRPTRFVASIVSVADEDHSEVLMLGQEGSDLLFRVRSEVPLYGLRATTIRVPGILSATADTVHLSAGLKDARYSLTAVTGHGRADRVVAISPSWGWSFLLPFDYAMGPEAAMLTALWIAGMLAPAAYWAAREAARPVGAAVFLVAAVVLGLAGVPMLFGLAAVHWSEWAAACAGIVLGLLAGRRSAAH